MASEEPVATLILDGIWGSQARWEPLRRKLDARIGPTRIWHYDNSGNVSLEELGGRLAAELRQIGGPFHLVGFSMGGLVIREAMRQAPELPLSRAALLHSPHSGSLAAHLNGQVASRDMRPGSAFIRRLEAAEWTHPTLVTWSAGDLMVLPGRSARWKRASLVIGSWVPAHIWPVFSKGVHRSVADFLAAH